MNNFEKIKEYEAHKAPVPSYEEWMKKLRALDAAHKAIKMEDETINRLVCSGKQCNYENAQLKELLKECRHIMSIEKDFASCHFEKDKLTKLLSKIDEVLK